MSAPRPAKTARTRKRIQLATVALFDESTALETIIESMTRPSGIGVLFARKLFELRQNFTPSSQSEGQVHRSSARA
jgi:hypothetical protein